MTQAIQKAAPQQVTVAQYLVQRQTKIAETLPPGVKADRLIQLTIMAVQNSPSLAKCSAASVYSSVMRAAQMGLEPNSPMGQCYLVPFKDQCTLIIGYRGLIDLARRGGELRHIEARVVFENEPFSLEYGMETNLSHRPILDSEGRGKPVAVYMVATLRSGAKHIEAMSIGDVNKIRGRSRSSNDGPWVTDFEEMARKTVIRRGLKYLPMNVELAHALAQEDEDTEQPSLQRADAEIVPPPASKTDRLKRELAAKTAAPAEEEWAPPLDEPEQQSIQAPKEVTPKIKIQDGDPDAKPEPGSDG